MHYKGGSASDQGQLNDLEQYNLATAAVADLQNNTWIGVCNNISRINLALRQLDNITDADYIVSGVLPMQKGKAGRDALPPRPLYVCCFKRLFNYPVWIEHTATQEEIRDNIQPGNLPKDQLWDKIAEDFQFAIDNLPPNNNPRWKANKWAVQQHTSLKCGCIRHINRRKS